MIVKKRLNGFTLIEVVIAMTIMAFLTIMVSQSMRRSADFKEKVQRNIDHRSAVNSAMRIIERDINLAYHYQDVNTEVLKAIESKKSTPQTNNQNQNQPGQTNQSGGQRPRSVGNQGQPNNQPGQATQGYDLKIREIPNHTAFIGARDSIHFTNLNNVTVQPGKQSSDQQEVGYFVRSCRRLKSPDESTRCLWRRTSDYIDDKVDEGGHESILIEGVTKFELRYFGKEKEDWVDSWDSTSEDAAIKNKFPSAVEVTLTIEQNNREISAISVIPLRFPNNLEDDQQKTQTLGQEAPPPPNFPGGG